MLKNKLFISVFALVAGLFIAAPVSAAVLSIQSLPGYISSNNFKLSCTSNGGPVQFYVSKNGGAYVAFGPSINTDTQTCVVQVDSSVVNDQTTYKFKANDVEQSSATEYDTSGPSPVSNYYKERINDGMYKLHFHTPSDGDFAKVIIYRGDTVDFSADAGHQIAQVSGGANSDMTYDDSFTPDPNKNYFYALRALDKAGNSSSLAGDGSTTSTSSTTTSTPGPVGSVLGSNSTKVVQLPKEGKVLGEEASPSPEAQSVETAKTGVVDQINQFANTTPEPLKWILTHKKVSIGIVLLLLALVYSFRRFRNNN